MAILGRKLNEFFWQTCALFGQYCFWFSFVAHIFMERIIFLRKLSNEPWMPNEQSSYLDFFSIFKCNDDDDDDEKSKIIDFLWGRKIEQRLSVFELTFLFLDE